MRLICPNCDAQYEVDDAAIPDSGRDVQCSNCGHAWYQMPPDIEAEMEAENALFGATQVPQPVSAQAKPIAKPPESKASPDWDDEDDDDDYDNDAAETAPAAQVESVESKAAADIAAPEASAASQDQAPVPVAPRRGLDESLLAVLREEAERETSVRRSEAPRPLETQPDLGLEDTAGAASAAKAVRDRLARLRGEEAEPAASDKPTARRDLLPDIEEINSTLRASTEHREDEEDVLPQAASVAQSGPKGGFRSGFSLMLLLAVVLIATYVAAPKIAANFPAAESAMAGYVATVDQARLWLDQTMRSAIDALQGLTGANEG